MGLSAARSQSCDRGKIRVSEDSVKQQCSLTYLHALYLELCRTRAFVLTSITSLANIQEQHERIQFLGHEFDRLSRYPALFPSQSIKHRFLVLCFHGDCDYHFSKSLADLLIKKELRKTSDISRIHVTRPTYMPASHGWENFLLPGGPGVPLKSKETEPCSAFQVLPGVGMRICSDFSREENDIIQFVHTNGTTSAKDDLKDLPFDSIVDGPKPSATSFTRYSSMRLRQHTQNIILTPSPFREDLNLRLDVRGISAATIERYSSMIYRVEQQGPGPNAPAAALNAPNVFPVMAIRSWHQPLQRWHLHYHSDQLSQCSCQQASVQVVGA